MPRHHPLRRGHGRRVRAALPRVRAHLPFTLAIHTFHSHLLFTPPFHRCERIFHARCERLDYSVEELQAIGASAKGFECAACEGARLEEAGYRKGEGEFKL